MLYFISDTHFHQIKDGYINLSVDVTNYKPISLDEINEMRSKNND